MSTNGIGGLSNFVHDFVSSMLHTSKLSEPLKSDVIPSFDELINPFILSEDDKKLKVDLAFAATCQIVHERKTPFPSKAQLEEYLVLAAPRKRQSHVVVPGLQPQPKPFNRSERSSKSFGRNVKPRPNSIVSLAEFVEVTSDSYPSHSSIEDDTTEQPRFQIPHEKFYPQISGLFQEFWDIELDEWASKAFFGRINHSNYLDFEIIEYHADICNLSIIKDRLDGGEYGYPDEFRRDFEVMFGHIRQHFSNPHAFHSVIIPVVADWERKFWAQWDLLEPHFKQLVH